MKSGLYNRSPWGGDKSRWLGSNCCPPYVRINTLSKQLPSANNPYQLTTMDSKEMSSDEGRNQFVESVKVGADSEDDDEELGEASVVVGLEKMGEQGSGYHTLNDPQRPYQRETAVDRHGVVEIQCRSREIVHGTLSSPPPDPDADDADAYATLLVYDIHFNARKASRRITSATVEFEFRSSEAGARDPTVYRVGPLGRVSVLPTQQGETMTVGGELSVSAPEMVANLGVTGKIEKTVSRTTNDEARVTGSVWSDDYGRPVIARWVLAENRSIKSGVPSFLRCAIVLARPEDNLFECRVTIRAESDWKSSVERLLGSTPRDDPILFDPALKPTNKLRKAGYDTDNLGALDLTAEFVDIRFSTAFTPGKQLLD